MAIGQVHGPDRGELDAGLDQGLAAGGRPGLLEESLIFSQELLGLDVQAPLRPQLLLHPLGLAPLLFERFPEQSHAGLRFLDPGPAVLGPRR
jgi:hypothetical protein